MTHSPFRTKPRFDEVEHKLYNRISSRLSSARQNRERSKSVEEIRRIRSPLRAARADRRDVGPRSQRYREREESSHAREEGRDRDRGRSRSPRRERTRKRSDKNSSRPHKRSPSSPRRRHRERTVSTSPKREQEQQGTGTGTGTGENWDWSNGDKDKTDDVAAAKLEEAKKPNFSVSGKLAEEANTFRGVVVKYTEPPEARMPKKRWRLYPFKGDETLPTLYIHRQSAYLIGRDKVVTDFPVYHPSCSKQHAVLQYRLVDTQNKEGLKCRQIKLYIIDLNSTNGTYINNKRVEPQRYIEMKATDMIRFGFSSREYILLNEDTNEGEISQESDQDEDMADSDSEKK